MNNLSEKVLLFFRYKKKQSEADKSQRTYQSHQQQISQTNIDHNFPFSAAYIEKHQNPKAKLSSNTSTKALLRSIATEQENAKIELKQRVVLAWQS